MRATTISHSFMLRFYEQSLTFNPLAQYIVIHFSAVGNCTVRYPFKYHAEIRGLTHLGPVNLSLLNNPSVHSKNNSPYNTMCVLH